jgi:hypothetical protein
MKTKKTIANPSSRRKNILRKLRDLIDTNSETTAGSLRLPKWLQQEHTKNLETVKQILRAVLRKNLGKARQLAKTMDGEAQASLPRI